MFYRAVQFLKNSAVLFTFWKNYGIITLVEVIIEKIEFDEVFRMKLRSVNSNMNNVNRTLYIPLYGKSYVSKRGLFINDRKAEEIWDAEGFGLKGKSKSKWLAYYMGIRSAVFDEWVIEQLKDSDGAVVIHIGCGLDSRVIRAEVEDHKWYDVDFPEVIEQRKRYYSESDGYKMLCGDARDCIWLDNIPEKEHAIVVMEGVSMYMTPSELKNLAVNLCNHFKKVNLLMDCYSVFAAKMSKYKNPINDVGVTSVYGIDDPRLIQSEDFIYLGEHEMTPQKYIDELSGAEKVIFRKLYAGGFAKRLYRLFEYQKV